MKKSQMLFYMLVILACSCKEVPINKVIDKCDTNPCGDLFGFDCVDGACVCPVGKFKVGITCATLNLNEFFGTSICSKLDTIKIDFGQSTQVGPNISTVLTTKTFATQMNGLRIKDNSQNLDSIVLTFPRTYMKDTIECTVLARGRFIDATKLKLNLKYYAVNQNSRFIESCDIILQK
jgi:hypothetical protein